MARNYVHKDVNLNIRIDGMKFLPTKLETDFNRYTQSDMVTATVIPVDTGVEGPEHGDEFKFSINGRQLFKGFIHNSKLNKDKAYEIKAFNALWTLKNEAISLSITDSPTLLSQVVGVVCRKAGVQSEVDLSRISQSQEQALFDSAENVDDISALNFPITIERTNTSAAKILDSLAKRANADWWVDNNNIVQFGLPDTQLRSVKYVKESSAGKTTPPYRGVKVIGSATASQYSWENAGLVGDTPSMAKYGLWYDDGQRVGDVRDVAKGYLKVTFESTGVITKGTRFAKSKDGPQYRATERVNVDMAGMAKEETKTVTVPIDAVGPSETYDAQPHQITYNVDGPRQITKVTNPQPVLGGLTEKQKEKKSDPGWNIVKGQTNSPVFTVKNKELDSKNQIDAVGRKLIEELKKQIVSGSVTIVGNPSIDTLDVIELPASMGGDRYFVGKVNHKIDNNGYTTKIGCEGLVPGRYTGQTTVDLTN